MNGRTAFLRGQINTRGRGLEIGPSYNPLLPKSAGFNVETVDYADAVTLRAKYARNENVDASLIETVDHVLDGTRNLAEVVAKPAYYDYVVASHVIEHVPDLLGFVQSCEVLLRPGGVLLLAVPDKRHCFDVFQPPSTTGAVLQAHLERRSRPTPGAIFDDRAYNLTRGGAIGWPIGGQAELRFFADLVQAREAFDFAQRTDDYIDVHIWRFVPSSFRLILRDLHEIGATGLRERSFYDSIGNEFYVSLSHDAQGCAVGRLDLARRALAEQAAVAG